MASEYNLLQLPDLVLYKICSHITCPFDLLNFGNTCSRLRNVATAQSLWWNLALDWCKGLWLFMKDAPKSDNPREWLLSLIKQYTVKSTSTKFECIFSTGEKWERIDSRKFRFLFGLLRLVYKLNKVEYPSVVSEAFLYDIGLYRRTGPLADYASEDFQFSTDCILQLSSLGQAMEHDLIRVKQPDKDPASYVKLVATTDTNWVTLFPSYCHGCVCPLLMDPLIDSITYERSGFQGVTVGLSLVLENHLRLHYSSRLSVSKVNDMITSFCTLFLEEVVKYIPEIQSRLESPSIRSAVLILMEENLLFTGHLQNVLNQYECKYSCDDIFHDLANFLKKYKGLDLIMDEVRKRIRKAMIDEISVVLCPNGTEKNITTKIDLTDCDLIGGDNYRQEMSASAFISQNGVLVTWHLIGRYCFEQYLCRLQRKGPLKKYEFNFKL